jgi:hypothetical protein
MLRYLDRADLAAQAGQRVVAPQVADPGGPPAEEDARRPITLQRRENRTEPEGAAAVGDSSDPLVLVRLVTMECGEFPRLVVESGGRRKTFVVLEPNRVVVTGPQPTAEGIPCGPQNPPVQMFIRYDPVPAGVTGDGVIREMHFPK